MPKNNCNEVFRNSNRTLPCLRPLKNPIVGFSILQSTGKLKWLKKEFGLKEKLQCYSKHEAFFDICLSSLKTFFFLETTFFVELFAEIDSGTSYYHIWFILGLSKENPITILPLTNSQFSVDYIVLNLQDLHLKTVPF